MYLAVPLSTGREGWPQAGVSPLFEDKMPPPSKTPLKPNCCIEVIMVNLYYIGCSPLYW